MYNFVIECRFPTPTAVTFAAATRDLDELLDDIPQLVELKTLQRLYLRPNSERIALQMQAAVPIPRLVAQALPPDWLRWREELLCRDDPPSIMWTIHSHLFGKNVHCHGKTVFRPLGQGTEACSRGELNLKLKEIPGVPSALVPSCSQLMESLLGELIVPNVEAYFAAVQRRLMPLSEFKPIVGEPFQAH